MTKSVRHKKARKVEVKKIKIKYGRRLKKAQNETKTDFKARKIIMKEQLVEKPQTSFCTKKKLNISDLLSRLSHHSVYVRQDGVNGLKELIVKYSKQELGPYLSLIFQSLNPCLLDSDHLIRMTTVKLIEAIILKIGNMIKPYFDLLSSHLSCAMVLDNPAIQSDSLHLMDIFLTHVPALIAQDCNKILNNYLQLISHKIDYKGKISSRTLISNPSSELSTLKWHIKLFKSLSFYVECILNSRNKMTKSVPLSQWETITIGCFPSLVKDESKRMSLYSSEFLSDKNENEKFIQTMIPLLFQSWAGSDRITSWDEHKSYNHTMLDATSLKILCYISELLLHFWSVVEISNEKAPMKINWFMNLLDKSFDKTILEEFPYSPISEKHEGKKQKAKSAKVQNELITICQRININLATFAIYYLSEDSVMKNKVAECYIGILSNYNSKETNIKLDSISDTVCFLMKKKSELGNDSIENLLKSSLSCFTKLGNSSKRLQLLPIILQATDFSCKHLWPCKYLLEWISAIVDDAIKNPTEEKLLEILLQFKLRNVSGFAELMHRKKDILKEKFVAKIDIYKNKNLEVIF